MAVVTSVGIRGLRRSGYRAELGEQRSELGESAVVDALRAGDESAFAELVTRHQPTVFRIARRHVDAHDVAEEIAQETWAAVVAGIDGFEQRSSLRTWILSIAARRAGERCVRERWPLPASALCTHDHPTDGGPTLRASDLPESRLDVIQLRDGLRHAFQALSERQRIVVALSEVEGYTASEIAHALGITLNNTRVLLHRGRAQLRSELRVRLHGHSSL